MTLAETDAATMAGAPLPLSPNVLQDWTFCDSLRRNLLEQPEALVFEFAHTGGEDEALTHGELARWVGRYAAAVDTLKIAGRCPPEIVLVLPQGRCLVAALMACLVTGTVAVPTFPPRNAVQADRLRLILRELENPVVLAPQSSLDDELAVLRLDPELSARWLPIEEFDRAPSGSLDRYQPNPDALAVIQFTSGSTGRPKGVMLTQRNLVENSTLIEQAFGHVRAGSRSVIWLPPYHDMGLVGGVLQPIHVGFPSLLMPTSVLVRSPLRWLEAIGRFGEECPGGVSSGGPNFAYQLCLTHVRERDLAKLDLRSWRIAFCGAEPISARTLVEFAARFARSGFRPDALFPCYGMAETTLMVSGRALGGPMRIRHLDARSLVRGNVRSAEAGANGAQAIVGCGVVHSSLQVEIVEPTLQFIRRDGELGEIWVRGPSLAEGYWHNEVATRRVFDQRLGDRDGWFRTGDLGFLDAGELYITGRIKEVLIVRGANYFPQDLEFEATQACPEFVNCRAVAFQLDRDDYQSVALALEVPRGEINYADIVQRINQRWSDLFGIRVDTVLFVPRKSIRLTSSGKLQRLAIREAFADGTLSIYHRHDVLQWAPPEPCRSVAETAMSFESAESICDWLLRRIAQITRSSPECLDPDESFAALAMDSVAAIDVLDELERRGLGLAPDAFYRHHSPKLLAQEIWRLAKVAQVVAGLPQRI